MINGPTYSDGDALHRPGPDRTSCTQYDVEEYKRKVAENWMKEEAGGLEKGKKYTLAGLPSGYALFQRRRTKDPTHIDRWLYGHSSKKVFDSPNTFYPHWKFLLNFGSGESCKCKLCDPKQIKRKPRRPASKGHSSPSPSVAPKSQVPPPFQKGPVDEEGTPDVIASLCTLTRTEKNLKRKIEEPASLDWRAEKPLVDKFACSIPTQASFLPRQGEVVLYLRPLSSPLELRQDSNSRLRIYDPRTDSYEDSPPQWLAGVITQVPTSLPTVSSLYPPSTSYDSNSPTSSLNVTGYRISPLPSVNSSNKLLSKQQTYTPLHLIRPFTLQNHVLAGIPASDLHESVTNALTASATVSLIDRHTFSGAWPYVHVHSRAIFIGPEAYWRGDTVILLPEHPSSKETITEIMLIKDIVTTHDYSQPYPSNTIISNNNNECQQIAIELQGEVYTTNPAKCANQPPIVVKEPTLTMQAYGTWYHLDQPGDVWAAPFSRTLCRLYEKEALHAWLPHTTTTQSAHSSPSTLLNLTRESVLAARRLAANADKRILDTIDEDGSDGQKRQKKWFWGEYRADALDLRYLAGTEVGRYDSDRSPLEWRSILGVLDGKVGRVEAFQKSSTRTVDARIENGKEDREDDGEEGEEKDEEVDGEENKPSGTSSSSEEANLGKIEGDELGDEGEGDGDENEERRKRMKMMPVVEID